MRYLLLILLPCLAFGQVSIKKSESSVVKFYDKKVENIKARYLTVEVGDSVKTKFDPSFKLSAWGDGCEFKVNLSTADKPLGAADRSVGITNNNEQTTLTTADVIHKLYVRADGNFEWEIIFPSKPDTNVFTYQIETKGLNFYYQPELTQEEIDEGRFRPDTIVGSYAVYHNSRANNKVIPNGKDTTYENYQTGQAFFIYRPTVVDSWDCLQFCCIEIDTVAGTLSLVIPQTFIDNAHYPITIGPTFGYTTTPGSTYAIDYGYAQIHANLVYTASTGDEVISFHVYGAGNAGAKVSLALYNYSDGFPVDRQGPAAQSPDMDSGPDWFTIDSIASRTLTDGIIYAMAIGVGVNVETCYYNDYGSTATSQDNTGLPETWESDATMNEVFGFYATYTEGGEEEADISYVRRIKEGEGK